MTREEYKQYETAVAEFITREGITFLSTSTVDIWSHCSDDCNPSSDAHSEECIKGTTEQIEGEPWFSWHHCDCCGDSDGGSREYLYARDASNAIVRFEICVTCVYYLEYGRLDDLTMLELDCEATA